MTMDKLTVKTVDGEKVAVATVDFNLGKVYVENTPKEGEEQQSVVMGMGIHGMAKFYKQMVFERAGKDDWKGYEEALDMYMSFKINEMIGVEESPIKLKDGELVGIAEGIKVVREDTEHMSFEQLVPHLIVDFLGEQVLEHTVYEDAESRVSINMNLKDVNHYIKGKRWEDALTAYLQPRYMVDFTYGNDDWCSVHLLNLEKE